MKQIYKRTLLLILILSLASNSMIAFASPQKTSASYDLEQGGTQTFYIPNGDGSYDEIVIEELSGDTKVDNGTYKITHKALAWSAGFYILTSNDKIMRDYSPFHEVFSGTISESYLKQNNTTTATYSFIHTIALIKHNTGVIVSISNSTLNVSKK